MNNTQYYKYVKDHGQEKVDQFSKKVKISDVEWNDRESQVRSGGNALHTLPQMKSSIESIGICYPPSVRPLPNGKYQATDGVTRLEAAKALGLEEVVVSTFEYDYLKIRDKTTRKELQYKSNLHLPTSPAVDADLVKIVQEHWDDGVFDSEFGITFDENTHGDYIEKCISYLKGRSMLTNMSTDKAKRLVEKALVEASGRTTFKTYTKEQAVDFFKQHNSLGWKPNKPKPGGEHNGVAPYFVSSVKELSPNLLGNVGRKFRKRRQDGKKDLKYVAVMWIKTTHSVTESSLKQELRNAIQELKADQAFYGFYYDKVYMLPQLESKQNMSSLIEVNLGTQEECQNWLEEKKRKEEEQKNANIQLTLI